jgi:hypothetical protein
MPGGRNKKLGLHPQPQKQGNNLKLKDNSILTEIPGGQNKK